MTKSEQQSFKDSRVKVCIENLEQYKKTPIQTLAKKIYSEYPAFFNSVESARKMLRYYAGSSGSKDRKAQKSTFRELTYKYNPFDDIPESHETEREIYVLDKATKKVGVLSDIHFPYHNAKSLKLAINRLAKEEVDTIILNGDILDFYQLSDFSKDPSKPKIKEEIEMGIWFIKSLREVFPNAKIYFKVGNHEMRLERWLKVKAPEFLGMAEFRLDVLLKFGENRIQLIEPYNIVKAGKLHIIHGHEYKGSGGVYPAKYIHSKTKVDTLCGHYHRDSQYIERNMNGDYSRSYTIGCLSELSPDFMPYNDWVHGFAIIEIFENGDYVVNNHIIKDGKIL